MTLADIRAYVLDFLQVDSSDLPQTVLDHLIAHGWQRTISSERRWSFYEQEGTFTTAAGVQQYPLDTLTGTPAAQYPWADIVLVEGSSYFVKPLPHVVARRAYAPNTARSGQAAAWSQSHDQLYLWPIPSGSTEVYTVVGYRQPVDWIAANQEVDAPDEFGHLTADYALSMAYTQQDDPSSAEQVQSRYRDRLANLRLQYVDDGTASPIILNGGTSVWSPINRLRDRSDYFG